MPRALWTGASGMAAQQFNVDVIANNIANVNTTGYKKSRVDFQDMYPETKLMPGARTSDQGVNSTGIQVGTGVRVSGTTRQFTTGNFEPTGSPTDLAIEGEGFFEVQIPNGESRFTRGGDFRQNADGRLVTPDGYMLVPAVTIPADASEVNVGQTGLVTGVINGVQTNLGTVGLVRFRNPAGLLSEGSNLFQATDSSGPAVAGTAGEGGYGTIRGSTIEKSNVEVVTELINLIVAQRAYELNSKSIETSDQMLRTANEIIR